VKKGEDKSDATPDQVGKELSLMVRYCRWTQSCIPYTFGRWRKDWFHGVEHFAPNWYLPAHLGGYGFSPLYGPQDWKVTRSQRLMAARFIADPRLSLYSMGSGMRCLSEFKGAVANWRWAFPDVQSDAPWLDPSQESTSSKDDSWLGRLAYAYRAATGSVEPKKPILRRLRREYRLHPMDLATICKYWLATPVFTNLPVCPKQSQLPISSTSPASVPLATDRKYLSGLRGEALRKKYGDDVLAEAAFQLSSHFAAKSEGRFVVC